MIISHVRFFNCFNIFSSQLVYHHALVNGFTDHVECIAYYLMAFLVDSYCFQIAPDQMNGTIYKSIHAFGIYLIHLRGHFVAFVNMPTPKKTPASPKRKAATRFATITFLFIFLSMILSIFLLVHLERQRRVKSLKRPNW